MENKYNYDWNFLEAIRLGRENLGEEVPVEVYRMMQYAIIETLEENLGTEKAENLIRKAGQRAGLEFSKRLLDLTLEPGPFMTHLQKKLKELKIGELRVERMDESTMEFVLTMDEDLECSGLPVCGSSVCLYDEGFFAGVLEKYSGMKFRVKETDCWALGNRTCRFQARPTV